MLYHITPIEQENGMRLNVFLASLATLCMFFSAADVMAQQYVETRQIKPEQALEALEKGDNKIKVEAIKVISSQGIKATEKSVRPLIQQVEQGSPEVKLEAIKALGSLRFKAQLATKPLIALLDDSDPEIREAAKNALSNIGTKEGLAAIQENAEKSSANAAPTTKEGQFQESLAKEARVQMDEQGLVKKIEKPGEEIDESDTVKTEGDNKRTYIYTNRYQIYRND